MKNNDAIIHQRIKKNIKRLRDENGLTRRDVSKILGTKENTYRIWEDEKSETLPKAALLSEIAKIYNVSINFLYRNEKENESYILNASTPDNSIYGEKYLSELSSEEKIMIMKIRRMTNADRDKVKELIGDIVDKME